MQDNYQIIISVVFLKNMPEKDKRLHQSKPPSSNKMPSLKFSHGSCLADGERNGNHGTVSKKEVLE